MSMRSMACIAVLFASISGSGAGCAHKYVEKVAVFARDGDRDVAVVQAPRSGMYHVQFIANDKYVKTPLYASDRWVMKGDPLGFREDDDGHLIAIAGEDEVALPDAPAQATHVMWYHKSKRPTQFAKSLALTLEVSAKLAAVGAMSAAVGTLVYYEWPSIVASMLGVGSSNDCDNTFSPPPSRSRHKYKRNRG